MSTIFNEKPSAASMPRLAPASVVLDGKYLAPPEDGDGQLWVRTTALVQSSPQELYSLWRSVERAPEWQEKIVSVTVKNPKISRWVMNSGDSTITWDSEVLADEPGKRIAWKSVGGDSDNAGEVIFEEDPSGRGTVVTVLQEFRMGKLASAWEAFVGRNPKQAVIENLRHFKALAETGEICRSAPQPHGQRGITGKMKGAIYGENVPTPPGERGAR
jgi:uncharacterized membrane protein